jgi:hypothetical protein
MSLVAYYAVLYCMYSLTVERLAPSSPGDFMSQIRKLRISKLNEERNRIASQQLLAVNNE